ncbi:exonuclease subunit SbcD [Leminorella grimontii]|uniref:exonuclease subunit SbcD n=1 Tax=Leminorella grimontii TaxID=82981 RepID=UPI0020865487|nr:exonuclease subunit SbcD [Leminorella grimontii]GKX58183.1 nuclease SbcCD subunit D [Leminorella grimontii]
MRIIHTSDWHLGQYFFTKSRAAEHEAFLNWLTEQVVTYRVDAVIVAGDVFDTASPPSYARELYNQFIVRLQPTGCRLVVLGGNHDAVAVLNESRALLACLNVDVIAGVAEDESQELLLLNDRTGEPSALLCAVPFIRQRDIVTSQAGQSAEEKRIGMQSAIAEHYRRVYELALAKRAALGRHFPIILTGHLTTVGASTSDSVREIYIGTLDAFPAQAFPPADYIALGHIHRPQRVAGLEHVRYSGSPIALSFDETGQEKSVVLVDLNPDASPQITLLPVPEFQPMRLIKGDIDEVLARLDAFKSSSEERPVWLDIEVDTALYLSDLQKRIQLMADDLPVEIVLLRRSKTMTHRHLERQEKETLTELTANDVFERRLAQEQQESPDENVASRYPRLREMFNGILDEVRLEGEQKAQEEIK